MARASMGVVGVVAGVVALFAGAPAAQAAGTPNIALDKSAPATVLYGEESTVTLHASNPTGQPVGYNLSFRDVLPAGVSYVAGSAPAVVGQPQVINNAPAAGQTTLIWSNVADLTANSSFEFDYRVAHSAVTYEVGDIYLNSAGAYVNCDPRFVPDFNALGVPTQTGGNQTCTGAPEEESYTGFATDSAATTITAIEIEKEEPSPEDELLRGLHDHQTVYTLTVTNNGIAATDNLAIEDFIPAGLEFLGCAGTDNTTDAPTNPGSTDEYPGSGPINPGNSAPPAACVEPDEVETVSDPPGHPAGTYTRVRWNDLADLAPNDVFTLRYVAAIPLRANTIDWNGAAAGLGTAPSAATGLQASNLDNNSGPETFEDGGSEPSYVNEAIASGDFDASGGPLAVTDSDTEVVHAEDLRILKSVNPGTLAVGVPISEWTLNIATGEYRFVDDLTVTDTLGDGYCPLGTANLEQTPPAADPECDPTGDQPSDPYTTVAEQADGTWEITWDETTDPALARIEPSSQHTITFPTRTRGFYQENFANDTPLLANDTASNNVSIEGTDWIICAPGAPSPPVPSTCGGGQAKIDADEPDGTPDTDVSDASQEGAGPTIHKSVGQAVNEADCLTAAYGDAAPTASPGDTLCYRLRMDFPGQLDSGSVEITDFIPPGTVYVPGSTDLTPANTAGIATASPPEPDVDGSALSWPLDDSGGFVGEGQVLELVFQVELERLATQSDGDLLDNLMKAVFINTAGTSFPLRDARPFELAQPEVTLLKGVRDVNNGPVNGPNVDGVSVVGGDDVTYRIDIDNDGSVAAQNAQVWDELPPQFTCAMVSNIDPAGTCNAVENRIEWTGIAIPVGGIATPLTYDVAIPDGLSPTDSLENHAGVRQYESPSGSGPYTTIPSENIDPTQDPNANAGPADDTSDVVIEDVNVAKSRTTAVTETPGNAAGDATIGEQITYTVTTTIPEGSTLTGANTRLTDNFGARHVLVGSPSATLDTDAGGAGAPVALPTAGLTLGTTGSTITIDFPDPYANPAGSGDDVLVLTFVARPADAYTTNWAQGNATQRTLPNTATFSWLDSGGGAQTDSASTNTTIVEPLVSLTKSNNAGAVVSPGEIITYSLNASNSSAVRVSNAHNATVVDQVPDGLSPVNGGVPVADGGTVNPNGGVWNETAHTITWTVGTLTPGQNVGLSYDAVVDNDATGSGTLVNTADLQVSSMAGTPTGERTSTSPGSPTGYDDDATSSVTLVAGTITKSPSPSSATIGEQVDYTLTISIPASIVDFDATVIDQLPDGLIFDQYVSATCTVGCAAGPTQINPSTITPTLNADGTSVLGWWFGDLASAPVPRTVELVYRAHVADTYDGGVPVIDGDTLDNQATFMWNQTDQVGPPPSSPPNPGDFDNTESDQASIDVVEPELALDKDVSGDPDDDDARDAEPGDSFTYALRVTNNGTAPAYDVTVTDQPDAELTNVVATTGAGDLVDPWTAGDPDMRWLIPGPIAPGATVVLEYTADLVPSAQLNNGQQVINTADVPSYFGVPEDDRDLNPAFVYRDYDNVAPDTVTITVLVPDLELVKTTGVAGFPDSAAAQIETPFPWRVTVTNPNAGSHLNGVDVTDTLPNNWAYVPGSAQITGTGTLTPGGQVEPTISGGGTTLDWANLGDLAGAENLVIEFQAEPSPQAAIDPGLNDPHVNDAAAVGEDTSGATASAAGPYADDDDASADLDTPLADLAIQKVAADHAPIAGTDVTWTLTATNNGPQSSPEATVTDTLPAGLTYVSATPERGTCDFAAGTLTCVLGTMAPAEVLEITLVTTVGADQVGQTILNAAEIGDEFIDDTDPSNDVDDDEVTPDGSSALRTEKVLLDSLRLGFHSKYRVTVTNDGPSDASAVELTDTLPAQLTYVGASDPSCAAAGQLVTCMLGDIAAGASASVELEVDVTTYSASPVTNSASALGTGPGTTTGPPGDTTDPILNADLAIRKIAPKRLVLGERATYKLEVTNVSQIPSGGTATVTDEMPKGLEPLTATGTGWACTIAGRLVTCDRSDSLPAGTAWPRISIDVRVSDSLGGGKVRNTAQVKLPGDADTSNDVSTVALAPEGDDVDPGGGGGAGDEPSCLGGRISAIPAEVLIGPAQTLKIVVEQRDGRAARGVKVQLRHQPSGDRESDKTNRSGKAKFTVRAESDDDRWVARVKKCGLVERISALDPEVCRAADEVADTGAAGAAAPAEPTRRRC